MTSLLPSQMAKMLAAGFNGKLMNGILRREVSDTLDEYGDVVTNNVENYAVQGIRDNFSAHYALLQGIPNTDVRILLIMGLIRPATEPLKDDKILMRGKWHQVRRVLELDPANASITLQCFEIPSPV